MKFVTSEYNGLLVSYTACQAGDTHLFRVPTPMARANVTTTQYWGGAFRYEKPDGSTLADITRGMLGVDLPDFPVAGDYTLRALEDGAWYFCVTASGRRRTQKQRILLGDGEYFAVPQGGVAVLDKDGLPQVVFAKTRNAIVVGPCQGLMVRV